MPPPPPPPPPGKHADSGQEKHIFATEKAKRDFIFIIYEEVPFLKARLYAANILFCVYRIYHYV